MGSRITGAEITLSSSTMAKGLPIFSAVIWAKRRVPRPLKRNEAIGSFVPLANPGPAWLMSSPSSALSLATR